MNRSYSKIRHIQESNRLLEERRLLIEQAVDNTWLTVSGDKNYTYQKQNNKWVAKNKAGKILDISKYPTTIKKLESQFPGGKAPVNNPQVGADGKSQVGADGKPQVGAVGADGKPQVGAVGADGKSQVGAVGADGKSQVGADGKSQVGADGKPQVGEGKVGELTGTRIFDNTNMEQPTTTSVDALVPFKIDGFTNNTTTPITIKLWKGDTDLVTSDLKVPITLQPKQSTGPFQVFIKVVDLDKNGDGWTPNQSVHAELDVAGPLRMKNKFLGYDIFGKLNLFGNDNTFITLKFKRTILVKN